MVPALPVLALPGSSSCDCLYALNTTQLLNAT